jgi:hypothetical protein
MFFIDPVFFILLLLVNDVVVDATDHKHNPSSLAIDVVIFKEEHKVIVKYTEKGTSTVLFN